MVRNFLFFLFLFSFFHSFSQTYLGQIINKKNDTIDVQIVIKGNMIFKNNKILSIQDKITVLNKGVVKDYFPEDLKSFRIRMNKKIVNYESVENKFFAERLYSNKVKLFSILVKTETWQSPYFAIYKVYFMKKPNQEKLIELISNGFSRLITQKEMMSKFSNCNILTERIEKDEIKIRSEKDLVEFMIDYENSCLKN